MSEWVSPEESRNDLLKKYGRAEGAEKAHVWKKILQMDAAASKSVPILEALD